MFGVLSFCHLIKRNRGRMSGKFSAVITAVILALLCGAAHAEGPPVLVIKSADISPYDEAVEGFKKTCNCRVREVNLPDIDSGGIREIVSENRPGLILAVGVDALSLAVAVKGTPIVYSMVPTALLPEISGRNLSGVSMYITPEKYINAISELFPLLRRVGVVFDPAWSGPFIRDAERAAHKKGIELVLKQVGRPSEVISALHGLKNSVNLLWMIPDPTVVNPETFKYMLDISYQRHIPVFTFARKYVEIGAAAGLNSVPYDSGMEAGEIAAQLLTKGLPETPIRVGAKNVSLLVNRRILKKIGIAIPAEVGGRTVNVE